MDLAQARRRTAELLEAHRPGDHASRAVDIFLISLTVGDETKNSS